jgi:hypothetical protein
MSIFTMSVLRSAVALVSFSSRTLSLLVCVGRWALDIGRWTFSVGVSIWDPARPAVAPYRRGFVGGFFYPRGKQLQIEQIDRIDGGIGHDSLLRQGQRK